MGLGAGGVVAIYSTADLARTLADALRESGLLEFTSLMFTVGMFLVGADDPGSGVERRLTRRRSRFLARSRSDRHHRFARGISAGERSHLIEYTVLALIVHEALRNGEIGEGASRYRRSSPSWGPLWPGWSTSASSSSCQAARRLVRYPG